jgi:ATP-dependent RNA helicase SUPV3L1/SUV3
MVEAESTHEGEAPGAAPAQRPSPFAELRGFQIAPAESAVAAGAADPADEEVRKAELAKELAARAARFAEAVDESLTLASDGAIRWLGDPVARLAPGEATLKPRAIVLADDALSAEGKETVERRVAQWLDAHVRKTLAPLPQLAEPEPLPEEVRDLALKLAQALGVLERERVKAQVKALDQTARGALRKLGVRFGAYYIFVPALLKPASRTLCAQLWALSRRDADNGTAAERALQFAASGRTSFAIEPPASAEAYRVAGFRICGERAVRVDIVERLMDLIRAALPRRPPNAGASGGENVEGFVVTSQMTSLTGCSGERFASILNSLGFASHMVKKAAYLAAVALRAAVAATEPAAPPPPAEAASGEAAPPPAEPAVEAAGGEPASAAAPAAEPIAEAASEREAAAEGAATTGEETTDEAVARLAAEAEGEERASEASAPAASDPPPTEEELIEIWRPAPHHPRRHGRSHVRPPHGGEAVAPGEARGRAPGAQPRKPWRDRPPAAEARPAANETARPAADGSAADAAAAAGGPPREDRCPPPRRGPFKKGGKDDERRTAEPAGGDKGRSRAPPPEPRVNLDSPFAKLLDLKPLLKSRDPTK